VQFLVNSMLLCVLGFQVVMSQSVLKQAVVAFFGLVCFTQLFLYTYGGQLIMDKSSSVADNFYEIDKDLIIIIARARKASVIRSGFYEANLTTFTTVLSATGSMITLLKSILDSSEANKQT
jgi:odorant receptor